MTLRLPGLTAGLMIAVMALKPFSRLSEAPLLILAIIGLVVLCRHARQLLALRSTQAFLAVFACVWVPMVWSTVFAFDVERSLISSLAMLRYALAGLALAWAWQERTGLALRTCATGMLVVVLVWSLDAAIQAFFGVNLLGQAPGERLNGLFGQGNLKLGPMLVLLLAPALWSCRQRGWNSLAVALYLTVGALQLVIATRAAWVMFALVSVMLVWPLFRTRPKQAFVLSTGALASLLLVAVLAFQLSDTFHERVLTTSQALEGDRASLDQALSSRLPIWQTAWNMTLAHPLSGVGVRGFRDVYARYAPEDDPWVAHPDYSGAFHAHHIVLEAAAETGLPGVLGLILAVVLVVRYWRSAPSKVRERSWPWLISLSAVVFPLNTHYAIYSTDWSMTLWWFAMLVVISLTTRDQQRSQE